MAAKIANKGAPANLRVRKLDGKIVKPALYNGIACGHGKYFAAMVEDKMLLDDNGKPRPFKSVGRLEKL